MQRTSYSNRRQVVTWREPPQSASFLWSDCPTCRIPPCLFLGARTSTR
jgi:hypothetical protein